MTNQKMPNTEHIHVIHNQYNKCTYKKRICPNNLDKHKSLLMLYRSFISNCSFEMYSLIVMLNSLEYPIS